VTSSIIWLMQQARNSGDDSKRPPSERRRTRNRSEREQNMNKLAQVRYRYCLVFQHNWMHGSTQLAPRKQSLTSRAFTVTMKCSADRES
jgi:hypothetical protein